MKPERHSWIGMYGDRDIFQKHLDDGYNEVAFGKGDWVDDQKVLGVFAFFHPGGDISTLEHYKSITNSGHTIKSGPVYGEYMQKGFEMFIEENGVKMSEKQDIRAVLNQWDI